MLFGVFAYFSRDMFPSKAVLFAAIFISFLDIGQAKPRPSIIRERHVIHAPIKFRVIHHYKIKKVPVIIKKHLHFHKHPEKAIVEEVHINHLQHDDSKDNSPHFELDQHDNSYTPHYDIHHQEDGKEHPLNIHLQQQDDSKSYVHRYKPQHDDSREYPPYIQHDDGREYTSHFGKYNNDNKNHHSSIEFYQNGDSKGYSSYIQHDDSKGYFSHYGNQQGDSKDYPSQFKLHQNGGGKGFSSSYETLHHGDSQNYPPLSQVHLKGKTKGYYKPQKHDNSKGHSSHDLHSEYEIPPGVLPQEGEEENQEEDYEDTQQSQEDYNDYEYE